MDKTFKSKYQITSGVLSDLRLRVHECFGFFFFFVSEETNTHIQTHTGRGIGVKPTVPCKNHAVTEQVPDFACLQTHNQISSALFNSINTKESMDKK